MTYLTPELIAVEIQEYAEYFIGSGDTPFCDNPDADYLCLRFGGTGTNTALPNGKFKILGTISPSMCDFDCEGLVDKVKHYTWGGYGSSKIEDVYLDYLHIDESICRTSIESFHSLLQSKNLDTEKRYLIIQKQ